MSSLLAMDQTGHQLMLGATRIEAFKALSSFGVRDGSELRYAPAGDGPFAFCVRVSFDRLGCAMPASWRFLFDAFIVKPVTAAV